ncbi:MAG: hypothetical protein E6I28_02630 [Chloroflexi bacterium]|nr:MAG: hypothetical protein E6I28_02630 [Chloroflexota bacterium]
MPDRPRSGTVPSWGLKLTSLAAVVNVFFFGFGYAATHQKTTDAPLQPPVAQTIAPASPTPAPTPAPNRDGRAPRATLAPGIRTSPGAPLTTTRHS